MEFNIRRTKVLWTVEVHSSRCLHGPVAKVNFNFKRSTFKGLDLMSHTFLAALEYRHEYNVEYLVYNIFRVTYFFIFSLTRSRLSSSQTDIEGKLVSTFKYVVSTTKLIALFWKPSHEAPMSLAEPIQERMQHISQKVLQ